jgi:hypothetical protein
MLLISKTYQNVKALICADVPSPNPKNINISDTFMFVRTQCVTKMRQSRIFSNSELKALHNRLKGRKDDPCGTFANRVKPKIIELFQWFKMRKKLQKLLESSKKKN